MTKCTIHLNSNQNARTMTIINKGSHSSHTFRIAYILLNCDRGKFVEPVTNEQISTVLKVGMRTIDRVKSAL